MDISGLLGDLYESAEKEQVTERPARPAEPPRDDEPVPAPLPIAAQSDSAQIAAAQLEAEQRAARLRIEEATRVPDPPAEAAAAPLPTTLVHEVHHDDLLPRKSVRRALNIPFKR